MALPTFQSVVYQSPWYPAPIDGSLQGLTVTVASQPDTTLVLAARLRQGQSTLAQGIGTSSTMIFLTLLPPSPLLNSAAYSADAQWIKSGTSPDWTNPSLYVTAPVVTSMPILLEASLTAGSLGLMATWQFAEASIAPSGVLATIFNTAPLFQCGYGNLVGHTGQVTFSTSVPVRAGAQLFLRALVPITATPPSDFQPPFSVGSLFGGALLPVGAPTLVSADYDGNSLQIGWTPPAPPATTSPTGLDLIVSSTTATPVSTIVAAGLGGAVVPLGRLAGQLWTAAGRARIGVVTGASGTAAQFITAVPAISAISVSGATVVGTTAVPNGFPAGTGVTVSLMAGDAVLASAVANAPGYQISLPLANGAATGLSLVAQYSVPASTGVVALTGPKSQPFAVLAFAPTFVDVEIVPSGSNWSLNATWLTPPDGVGITQYTLTLSQGTTAIKTVTVGAVTSAALSFPTSAVNATSTYSLTLMASNATGTSPLAAAAVTFATAAFATVSTTQSSISASWTAPAIGTVQRYRLRLLDLAPATPQVLRIVESAGLSASFDIGTLALSPSGSYGLDLTLINGPVSFQGASDGTSKTLPHLVLGIPTGLAVTTSTAGIATLTWQPVATAAGYTLVFSDGRAAAQATTNTYTFASRLTAGSTLGVSIVATRLDAGVTFTAPASSLFTMPTTTPQILTADYDGISVTASWEPVPGSLSYLVTVLNNGVAGPTASTGGSFISFQTALANTGGPYSVLVQAVMPGGTGLPSDPLPLIKTDWYLSVPSTTAAPYIFPAAAIARAPAGINLYLPALGPTAMSTVTVGAFSLVANSDTATQQQLPYILQIASTSEAWNFAPSTVGDPPPTIRTALASDYLAFLQAAEDAGAQPFGISILQEAIARWMPQTFAEMLYYAFGLTSGGGPGTGTVDLRPGLILRAGSAAYTNTWSGDQPSWLNGFSGGPSLDFELGDSRSPTGVWQVTMDAFIARLVSLGLMTVQPPGIDSTNTTEAGVADSADLFYPGFTNPFYRVFAPAALPNPSGVGNVIPNTNFAIATAATFRALQATSVASASTAIAYFRGRAVLRLMIRVSCNDVEVIVPIGTTIGNMLDRYGVRPPASGLNSGNVNLPASGLHLAGLSLVRSGGPALAVVGPEAAPPLIYAVAATSRVRFDWATMADYGNAYSWMDMPLLPGDRITF